MPSEEAIQAQWEGLSLNVMPETSKYKEMNPQDWHTVVHSSRRAEFTQS